MGMCTMWIMCVICGHMRDCCGAVHENVVNWLTIGEGLKLDGCIGGFKLRWDECLHDIDDYIYSMMIGRLR